MHFSVLYISSISQFITIPSEFVCSSIKLQHKAIIHCKFFLPFSFSMCSSYGIRGGNCSYVQSSYSIIPTSSIRLSYGCHMLVTAVGIFVIDFGPKGNKHKSYKLRRVDYVNDVF